MAAGALMTKYLPLRAWGIKTLDAVEPGLPVWSLPDFTAVPVREAVTISLSVAVVIMAGDAASQKIILRRKRIPDQR